MRTFPFKIIDLTHLLEHDSSTWSGKHEFVHTNVSDHATPPAEYSFKKHILNTPEGAGTHMDAPNHCAPDGITIDQIPLAQLTVPCHLIDISHKAHATYQLSAEDILDYEAAYGTIQPQSFALIKTGWDKFWKTPQYQNNYQFPDISVEAGQLLVNKNVMGLGVDTLSPDTGKNGFPIHNMFLQRGRILVENATNLEGLPASGFFIQITPIKIKGGTEAPIRLSALVPTT